MKRLIIQISISGMCEENFTDKINIYKPCATIERRISFPDFAEMKINRVSDLITYFKNNIDELENLIGAWGIENFNYQTIYIKHQDYLLGFQEDKLLSEIFEQFDTNKLVFIYIVVAGEASIHCAGYKFVIHPNESIHKHHPHVHVIRDDISVRYSLTSLERFPQDRPSREHLRDEKKTIIPTLIKNEKRLLDFWNLYMHGYIPPAEDEQGNQFYKES